MTQLTAAQPAKGLIDFKAIFRKYGIVAILLGLCLILSIVSPAFRTMRNVTNIIRQVSAIGLISIGVTFCIVTGGIDLSTGSVVGLISVIVASMAQNQFNPDQPISIVMPLVLALVIALASGALVGFVNGAITAYGNIPPFIATLGMMTVARGVAQLYSGGRPIGRMKDGMIFIGSGSLLGIPIPILIYILVAAFAWLLLSRSRLGKHVTAIGCNIQAARICGINIKKTLVIVYVFCGFCVAAAAIIITGRTAGGNPAYGLGYELDAIASTVIGGTSLSGGIGSIPLCVVGALIIGVINNGMDLMRINPYWQQIVKGTIIVVAVLLDARRQGKG